VAAVIAPSFARIFYRNAVNIGLPLLVCKDSDRIEEGDEVEVNPSAGTVRNITRNETYAIEPLPAFVGRIAEAGGILEFIKRYGWEGVGV
jgi:3-isopropylmalate/(R)-2-methylmalate dehydratase small subunit